MAVAWLPACFVWAGKCAGCAWAQAKLCVALGSGAWFCAVCEVLECVQLCMPDLWDLTLAADGKKSEELDSFMTGAQWMGYVGWVWGHGGWL